jgi:hypothetical protein
MYLHTNLRHCSDLGRLAFFNAQDRMSTILATAKRMISKGGSIDYIVDVLQDPEDARYNLKPEIEVIKMTANRCLDSAKDITAMFEYWYLAIVHLRQTSLSRNSKCFFHFPTKTQAAVNVANDNIPKDEIVKEKEATLTKKAGAAQDQQKYKVEEAALKAKFLNIEKQLRAAKLDVDRAQIEVDRLHFEPIIPEPSALEEIARVQKLVPNTPPPQEGEYPPSSAPAS